MKERHFRVELTQVVTQIQYVTAPTGEYAALLAGLRWERNGKHFCEPTIVITEVEEDEWES